MNQQEQEPNTQAIIEDLTVDKDATGDVKGGPIYLQVDGVDGDSTAAGGPIHGGWDLKQNVKC